MPVILVDWILNSFLGITSFFYGMAGTTAIHPEQDHLASDQSRPLVERRQLFVVRRPLFKAEPETRRINEDSTLSSKHNKGVQSLSIRESLQHVSSKIFLQQAKSGPTLSYSKLSSIDLLRRYNDFLFACATVPGTNQKVAYTPAERASCSHQLDLLNAVEDGQGDVTSALTELGFNATAYSLGAIHSDLGKLRAYKELLTTPSAKSDLLLETISGRGDSNAALLIREVLDGKTLLNPRFSPDKIRAIFVALPVLQGFFHELPGLADAIMALDLGIIDDELFKGALKANLFHNGPKFGFLAMVASDFIPKAVRAKGLEREFVGLLENTPFEVESLQSLTPAYPISLSFEGVVHNLFDRVSQGTKGGLYKIYHEIGQFRTPPPVRFKELQSITIGNTLIQLEKFRQSLETQDFLSEEQRQFLAGQADQASNYLADLKSVFNSSESISWDESTATLFLAKNVFVQDGAMNFGESNLFKPEYSEETQNFIWTEAMDQEIGQVLWGLLESFERVRGNPMRITPTDPV